jgi:hypothetical protein
MIVMAKRFDNACIIRGSNTSVQDSGNNWTKLDIGITMFVEDNYSGIPPFENIRAAKDTTSVQIATGIINQIRKCIEKNKRIILIPLTLYNVFQIAGEVELKGHTNALILRVRGDNESGWLERFEPHGRKTDSNLGSELSTIAVNDSINSRLIQFCDRLSTAMGKRYEYRNPETVCPHNGGPQAFIFTNFPEAERDVRDDDMGYCQLHSLLIMELIYENPTLPTRRIVNQVMSATGKDMHAIRRLMRGYVIEMQQILRRDIQANFDISVTGAPLENALIHNLRVYIDEQNA